MFDYQPVIAAAAHYKHTHSVCSSRSSTTTQLCLQCEMQISEATEYECVALEPHWCRMLLQACVYYVFNTSIHKTTVRTPSDTANI